MKKPKIEDKIYVYSSYYVYRGADDYIGGIATITDIKYDDNLPEDHINHIMIQINNQEGHWYNYKALLEKQEELKDNFGDKLAHADPDTRPEFNNAEEGWSQLPFLDRN